MSISADHMRALGERVIPILQEFGVTGFVLTGYVENSDGKRERILFVNTQGDPAMEDGLRPLIQFGHMWSHGPQQGPDEQLPSDRTPI